MSAQSTSTKSLIPILGVPAIAVLTALLRKPLGDIIAPPVAAAVPAAFVGWIEYKEIRGKPREQRVAEALSGESFRDPWIVAGGVAVAILLFQAIAGAVVGFAMGVSVGLTAPSTDSSVIRTLVVYDVRVLIPVAEIPFLYLLFRGAAYRLRQDRLRWLMIGVGAAAVTELIISLIINKTLDSGAFIYLVILVAIQVAVAARAVAKAGKTRDLYRLRQAYRAMSPEDRRALVELGLGAAGQGASPAAEPTQEVVVIPSSAPVVPAPAVQPVPSRPDV